MDKVQKHLDDIERKITKANKIAEKGDSVKLTDAIKLGQKSNSIVSSVKKTIKEYDSFTPTDEESKKILARMKTIVGLSTTQLNLLVGNKAHLEKLHVGGLVKKNMNKTDEAGQELAKAMLAKTPAEIKADAEDLEKQRKTAFDKANAAYEGSSGGEDQADGEDDSD